MIVLATEDFEVYHEVLAELRERDLTFTSIQPGEPLPEETSVVVTGAGDDLDVPDGVHVVIADPSDPRSAVDAVLANLRGGEGRTVIGIDPGDQPGVAVLNGDTVVAAFQVPAGRVADVVAAEVESAVDPLVRVGDGARLIGARIIDDLPDVPVELVDETGTTPYLGTGARGMGDVLAAVNIAHLTGEPIQARDVTPSAGELQRIKDRSREASETNRAIDGALARRVAAGELTIDEALAEHRSGDATDEGGVDDDAADRDAADRDAADRDAADRDAANQNGRTESTSPDHRTAEDG